MFYHEQLQLQGKNFLTTVSSAEPLVLLAQLVSAAKFDWRRRTISLGAGEFCVNPRDIAIVMILFKAFNDNILDSDGIKLVKRLLSE